MSDYICIHCAKEVRGRQEALECDKCSRWQHRICDTGVPRTQYLNAVKNSLSIDWTCKECEESAENVTDPSIIVNRSFAVPELIVETSIQEDPIDDVPINMNPTKDYQIVDSGTSRGKRKLVDMDGFSYTVRNQKGDHTLWRCSKRNKTINCPATIIQDGDVYKPGLKEHVHPAEPGSHIAIKIKAEVKTKAVFRQSSRSVVQSVIREHGDVTAPEPSRPKMSNLTRTCNRVRQSLRPADPVTLDDEINIDFLDQHTPDFFRKDVTVGSNRHLIFYTDRQLQLLAQAKTWYMDGTFRVVNEPWTQLFSIHAFVKSGDAMKQIPLVFCVMSGKSKDDYYETAYNQKDSVYTYLRRVMALPFLPPEHIPATFQHLDDRCPPELEPIMDYVYRTWLQSSIFKVEYWTIFMTSIRTNNDVEGWHNHLNSKVATRGPVPFYLLITELYKEATDIPMQLKMVTEGKLQRYQKKRSREVQGKVFHLWQQYIDRDLSASRLLKECASIYGPPASL